jgi:hypothetical protein
MLKESIHRCILAIPDWIPGVLIALKSKITLKGVSDSHTIPPDYYKFEPNFFVPVHQTGLLGSHTPIKDIKLLTYTLPTPKMCIHWDRKWLFCGHTVETELWLSCYKFRHTRVCDVEDIQFINTKGKCPECQKQGVEGQAPTEVENTG